MRRTALLTVLLIAVVGCGEQSRIDPNATVTVRGAAQKPDGTPLTDRPVRLGSGVPADDALLAVLTAGLACTSGVCRGTVLDSTTGVGGKYAFSLKGRDTQGSFGQTKSELVTVSAAPGPGQVSGASASARFVVQATDVPLPALRLVDPALRLTAPGPAVQARWRTTRSGPYVLSFEAGAAVVWQTTTAASTTSLDGRVLEGTAGQAVLSGTSQDTAVGTKVSLGWRSPGVAYAARQDVPVSRGALCTVGPTTAATPGPDPCVVTDGDLTSAPVPPAGATTVRLELPDAPRADLLVVRGCSGGCPVTVSADGVSFRRVATVGTSYATVTLDRRPLRAITVGLGQTGLSEISAFLPSVEPAFRPVSPQRLANLRAPYGASPTSDRHRGLLYGVAGTLVALGLLALGVLIGRRRR